MFYNMNDYHIELDKLGKVIIYLRKSREDMIDGRYASDEETLSRHEEQLQTWAKANLGYEIPEDCIFKEVVSGEKIKTRPVFQNVLKMVEEEDIDGILVVNCSRLSRGDLVDCGNIIKILEVTDTLVLSPQKIYNLKNKYDKRFFKDELLRGNDYLEQAKELLSNGRHWSVSQGKFIGSATPFGYDKVSCKEMKVSDEKGYTLKPNENAEYVRMIFDMFLNGAGTYKIATHLININAPLVKKKEWDHCKVRKILTNPTYYGYLTYGRRAVKERIVNGEVEQYRPLDDDCPIYKGLHEPIVTKEEFDLAQELLAKNNTVPVRHDQLGKNPLAGLVKCACCGKAMIRQTHYNNVTRKRKHDLDKEELQRYIEDKRVKANISKAEIMHKLGLKKHFVYAWFGNNPNKFYPSEVFIEHWQDLKKILKITTTKYDSQLTEFVEEVKKETFICSSHRCGNVSSKLEVVEDKILEEVKKRYQDYNYYLDNYEEEYKKKLQSNKKNVTAILKKIEMKNTQLKNIKIAFEQGADTLEEYIARKKELNDELEVLLKEKDKISDVTEEEKIITIKKAIPILENVFKSYYSLEPSERNELLKTIIESVMYLKENNYSNCGKNKEVLQNIKLDICWLF